MIGCFHFIEGEYKLACGHLEKTQALLADVQGACEVDRDRLRGFLLACEGMLGEKKEKGEEKRKRERHTNLSPNSLEKFLQAKDYQVRTRHVRRSAIVCSSNFEWPIDLSIQGNCCERSIMGERSIMAFGGMCIAIF